MPYILEMHLPTEEELEQGRRFRAYLNYLFALSSFIGERIGNEYAEEIASNNSFHNIQGGRCGDFEKLGRLLRNAWFTELQLQLPTEFNDFVPYANHWAPVQAYYSVYLILRAYFLASGQDISHEHATNLKVISEEIQRRPDLFPAPWKVLCVGNPEQPLAQMVGLPDGIVINQVNPLASPLRIPFWDSYALFLKTTRARQLNLLCDEWKRCNRRQRVSPNAKREFRENLGPTTLFHALYRLRLRSNYSDADSFLLGVQDIDESRQFHASVCSITWFSLLIFEMLICRYIGKMQYESIAGSFRKYDRLNRSESTVSQRLGIFKNLW